MSSHDERVSTVPATTRGGLPAILVAVAMIVALVAMHGPVAAVLTGATAPVTQSAAGAAPSAPQGDPVPCVGQCQDGCPDEMTGCEATAQAQEQPAGPELPEAVCLQSASQFPTLQARAGRGPVRPSLLALSISRT